MKLSQHRWFQALSVLLGLLVLSALALAEGAAARLTGVKYLERGEQGELELTLDGQATVTVEPLANQDGLRILLDGTDLATDFALPVLPVGAAVTDLSQKATLENDTPVVVLTAKIPELAVALEDVKIDATQAGIVRIVWPLPARATTPAPAPVQPEPIAGPSVAQTDLLAMTAPEGVHLSDIAISGLENGEMVVLSTSGPTIPVVREAVMPTRLIVELDGVVATPELISSFHYNDPSGIIAKVNVEAANGALQVILEIPAYDRYDVADLGNNRTAIRVYAALAPIIPEIPVAIDEPAPMPATVATDAPIEAEAPVSDETPNSAAMDEALARAKARAMLDSDEPINNGSRDPEKASQTLALGMGDTEPTTDDEPSLDGPALSGYSDSDLEEYPDLPMDAGELSAEGDFQFPSLSGDDQKMISDAIVSLNFVGASFVDVMMILAQQAGVNFVLDAYWNQTPTGHVRERQPGGPAGDPTGGGGFGPGSGFGAANQGSVTMFLQEVPFDQAFKVLMQSNNLDYKVFRDAPDSEPLLFISTRERLEGELGLGVIQTYQLHYVPPEDAYNFLYQMDLLPSTGDFGIWFYGGGGGGGGGNGGGGGGNGGGGGGNGGGGGGNGGGGGGGFNMPSQSGYSGFGLNTGQPAGFGPTANPDGGFYGGVGASGSFYGIVNPGAFQFSAPENPYQPMQGGGGGFGGGGGGGGGGGNGGGGGGGGGNGGGGGGGGGGGQYTAKPGAIGIMATAELHEQITEALQQIDKPPRQVYVEATFLTFDDNPNQVPDVFGLDNFGAFAIETGGDRFPVQFDATGAEGLVFSILPKNQRLPFDDFRARYQYLFSDRKAKIVTAPRVAVIDGQTATVGVTENRPFIIDGGIIIDQFGNAVPAPDIVFPVQTGTFLTITPFIDDFGNITMSLNPQINSLLGEPQLINGNLIFGTTQTQVNTTLRLRDGETIVIGGLTRRDKDVNRQYVPFLGDIPIIGKLFGREEIIEVDSQLVVLITTHLVGS